MKIGAIKTTNEDFKVHENIHFALSGAGEHIWLYIEKNNLNTQDVIKWLSKKFGIMTKHVGYSGLKRQACNNKAVV